MNSRILLPLVAAAASLLLGGCVTAPPAPVVYQVPIEGTVVRSDFGPANLPVNGVQDVPAAPGLPLYYQVIAPANIVAYAFDRIGPGPGGPLLGQFQGTSFYSSVTPSGGTVEFVFSATPPVIGGSIQLMVSSQPFAGSSVSYTAPAPPPAFQPAVTISPVTITTVVGQPVTFTVSGGAGTGAFIWGGAAPASGWSNMYTFSAPGTYNITVYRAGDATYAQSSPATATVTITPPAAPPATAYPAGAGGVTVTPVQ